MSERPESTLGYERFCNVFMADQNQDHFVKTILNTVPEFPDYCRRMKKINSEGPAVLKEVPGEKQFSPSVCRGLLPNPALWRQFRNIQLKFSVLTSCLLRAKRSKSLNALRRSRLGPSIEIRRFVGLVQDVHHDDLDIIMALFLCDDRVEAIADIPLDDEAEFALSLSPR